MVLGLGRLALPRSRMCLTLAGRETQELLSIMSGEFEPVSHVDAHAQNELGKILPLWCRLET